MAGWLMNVVVLYLGMVDTPSREEDHQSNPFMIWLQSTWNNIHKVWILLVDYRDESFQNFKISCTKTTLFFIVTFRS